MMASTALRVERKPKLSESVVATIRKQLQKGEIQPGQKLPTEGQLTETFGVSRTVIREALAKLASEGLVEARQGAGVFVIEHISTAFGAITSEMGTRDSIALNVLEVRLAIEIESAGLAAIRRNAAQEAAIQEAFFEFERLLLNSEPTGGADLAFHRAIASATNNPFYVEMLDVLGRRAIPCDVTSPWSTELVQSDEYQRGLQREHLVILNAISAGDAEAARDAMRVHLSASQQRYRERLQARQSYYSANSDTVHDKALAG
jgi:DNA-binding FadR family transcriptional regulator